MRCMFTSPSDLLPRPFEMVMYCSIRDVGHLPICRVFLPTKCIRDRLGRALTCRPYNVSSNSQHVVKNTVGVNATRKQYVAHENNAKAKREVVLAALRARARALKICVIILEWTTSLNTSSRTLCVCLWGCPRHVERRVT